MRLVLALTAAVIMASTGPTVAQQSTNTQQERMKSCNTAAGTKSLTGDARKSFMSSCLAGKTSGSGSTVKGSSPQDRMKSCNTQAGAQQLTGQARKSFLSSCLKGH